MVPQGRAENLAQMEEMARHCASSCEQYIVQSIAVLHGSLGAHDFGNDGDINFMCGDNS